MGTSFNYGFAVREPLTTPPTLSINKSDAGCHAGRAWLGNFNYRSKKIEAPIYAGIDSQKEASSGVKPAYRDLQTPV